MSITIVQTSDPIFYFPMLCETAKTVRAYCLRHGHRYEQYVGIKRGTLPWQATYNRIIILKEMLERSVEGWVLYLDADAMIVDQHFDYRAFFAEHNHLAGVFAGWLHPGVPHTINAGGFAINLSHPVGRLLINEYAAAFQAISDAEFNEAIFWEKDILEDQHLLHVVLGKLLDAGCREAFLFEHVGQSHVNYGPVIHQALRSIHGSFKERLQDVTRQVADILTSDVPLSGEAPGIYMPADHARIHTSCGRKDAGSIMSAGRTGTLVYGPYLGLAAGSYSFRLFGSVAGSASGELRSDVCSEFGNSTWAERAIGGPVGTGLLVEHKATLDRDVDKLEIRLFVAAEDVVRVDAMQVLPNPTTPA